MKTLKAGTRCSCVDLSCARGTSDPSPQADQWRHSRKCGEDAVRVVTIPTRSPEYYERVVADVRATLTAADWKQVPMCETCANWHEGKVER